MGGAITADQGENLVTINLACRRLDESNRVVSPGTGPACWARCGSTWRPHDRGDGCGPGSTRSPPRPRGLLMLGYTGQPGPDRFFQVGTITTGLEQSLIALANRPEPPVFDRLPADDRTMHGIDSVELRGDFGRPG